MQLGKVEKLAIREQWQELHCWLSSQAEAFREVFSLRIRTLNV